MRIITIYTFLLLSFNSYINYAAAYTDSSTADSAKNLPSVQKASAPATYQQTNDASSNKVQQQTGNFTTTQCTGSKCYPCMIPFISLLPVILFIIIIPLIFASLKKGGYKISDALKENEFITGTNTQPNSSSRLIAFLTAMTTLAVAVSVTSYWMYCKFFGLSVNLSDLNTLLISLGFGVAPYGFNKVSKMFS